MTDSDDSDFDWKAIEQLARGRQAEQVTPKSKSSARVERFVSRKSVRQISGGLKPDVSRSYRLVIRFSKKERETIVRHAEEARMTISQYARLTLLKSSGLDPQRNKYLMKANYELTRQGINLNQISKQLNSGTAAPNEVMSLLSIITHPMAQAFQDLRNAIAGIRPEKTYS